MKGLKNGSNGATLYFHRSHPLPPVKIAPDCHLAPHSNLARSAHAGKRRYNIKLWKTFTDCFNCLPVAAIVDEKIFCMHGGLSPELNDMEQIKRVLRPTDVPDTGEVKALRPQSGMLVLDVTDVLCSVLARRLSVELSY